MIASHALHEVPLYLHVMYSRTTFTPIRRDGTEYVLLSTLIVLHLRMAV